MLDNKDFEVNSPPTDGISALDFSSQADYLAVSSWDNQVRIYEVQPSGTTLPKASYAHEGPALCVTWSKDGTKVVSGGADKAGRMFDISTGQSTQIAQHDDTIKCVKFLDQGNIVATGSWDKTVKYWDLRSPQPVGTVQLPERCYALDAAGPLMVVGTAEKHICVFDLNNPTVIFKNNPSPLKWQTRVVSCFTDSKGFAIGSIEGRVGIQYVEDKDSSFHPIHGTFSTAGSDGTVSFWDKDCKQRLKPFPKSNGQIACTAFNRNGSIFAYGVSYDWSKGYKQALATNKNMIYLHAVRDEEIKPRSPKKR
ncbi:WD40 repeat-like protein [Backusella circina FSU 941]|nr:WD40 repeat-like protein [Backusella circina FSU 941]